MLPELERGFEAIEAQRATLTSKALALSDEALTKKPTPEAWSVRQVVEHLVIADETVGQRWPSDKAAPDPLRLLPRSWRTALIEGAFRRNLTLPLPSPEMEPRGDAPLPALLERWAASRAEMRWVLEALGAGDDAYAHAILGPLTASQMLSLAQVHTEYHTRQIDRLIEAERDSNV